VIPNFGGKRLTEITREEVKLFLSERSQATKRVKDKLVPKFARNTLRLMVCALRTVLNAAVEDRLISTNLAAKVGKFAKSARPAHEASAMTREEIENFLTAIDDVCPRWKPFFLAALRTGMRKCELLALKWGQSQAITRSRKGRSTFP